jgi:hypothetical protein
MNVSAFFVDATILSTETHIPHAKAIAINPPPSLSSSIVVQSMIFTSQNRYRHGDN